MATKKKATKRSGYDGGKGYKPPPNTSKKKLPTINLGPGWDEQPDGPFDMDTEDGAVNASLAIIKATLKTGADPDYAVYLLLETARVMSGIREAQGHPGAFAAALDTILNKQR
jgi:hypothetical protein